CHAKALVKRHYLISDQLLAEGVQFVVQIDLDRANVGAGTAQARGERQAAELAGVAQRREQRTDRARDGVSIAVAARAPEHWAGVHTGAAADAGERAAESLLTKDRAAAVVDN